jgi:hypothetical protein
MRSGEGALGLETAAGLGPDGDTIKGDRPSPAAKQTAAPGELRAYRGGPGNFVSIMIAFRSSATVSWISSMSTCIKPPASFPAGQVLGVVDSPGGKPRSAHRRLLSCSR